MRTIETDILIFGGGIAGLWLLNRLRSAGYSVILLEQDKLGGHETLNANGIIHGGLKFGLSAMLRDIEDLDDMPALWRDCLQNGGDLSLKGVRVLSEHQYLWSEPSLAARATAFFASRLITGQVEAVEGDARPAPFHDPSFEGNVYQLSDLVIDVPSLVQKLASPHKNSIYKVSPQNCHLETDDRHNTSAVFITAAGMEPLRIHPRRVILAGGQGNKELLDDLGLREPVMERRPVHMVLLKHPNLPAVYAHCLGNSTRPRLTITTHPTRDGEQVWYIGGELAEEGAQRDGRLQIEHAQRELKELLPWVDLRGARFKAIKLDRILPAGDGGFFKPENAFVEARGNNIVVWPCKMTLAPNLGRQVLALLEKDGITPQHPMPEEALPLLRPEIGQPAWETLFD
ncbi:MAG: FAD-dependent oxidoreductase [Moraxellaceae bacterium]|nr:FAD-dependent oxidoreductase [Moraxellaceae bacterium]MBP8852985.1 FAD-dependent oxidoreductase [Moraxellaceae bacterium]MBP9731249.1 FAD-dependent oxidoreductase [Moraxellaceae bacterium]